jgi:hypothetical protein
MSVFLNQIAFKQARALILNLECVLDEHGDWTLHRPTRGTEKRFLVQHGYAAFAAWHLGEDDSAPERSQRRCKFPYGDFKKLHRCGVLAAEQRARQFDYADIEKAAVELQGMLDELMHRGMPKHRHVPQLP